MLTTLRVAASIQILEGRLDLQPQEALLYAQPLSNTFRYLGNPEKSLRNYVVPGAVANIVQAYHVYVSWWRLSARRRRKRCIRCCIAY